MDEFEIIRRYFTRAASDASVLLGVGDDGAVLRPDPGRCLVCVVDALVDGVHYPGSLSARDVGYRAVAVNLSDIAAMAGRPRWMTLSLTLVSGEPVWLEDFAAGLFDAAAPHGLDLVGGDTTSGPRTVVSVQIIGDVEPERWLTRSGAGTGDDIYVTGLPGEAAGGLAVLQSGGGGSSAETRLAQRFRRPEPRLEFAEAAAPSISAAIDVSDGLYADLGKLLAASDAGGSLDLGELPRSPALQEVFGEDEALRLALAGGDDYELCFTARPEEAGALQVVASGVDLPITRIGTVTAEKGLHCFRDGEEIEFGNSGYTHFAQA